MVSIITNMIGYSRGSADSLMQVCGTRKLLLDAQTAKEPETIIRFRIVISVWTCDINIRVKSTGSSISTE